VQLDNCDNQNYGQGLKHDINQREVKRIAKNIGGIQQAKQRHRRAPSLYLHATVTANRKLQLTCGI
jgi:hypothetical protein